MERRRGRQTEKRGMEGRKAAGAAGTAAAARQHDDKAKKAISPVVIEIAEQLVHPATDASPRIELVIAVREEPDLHLDSCQRDVTKGMQ